MHTSTCILYSTDSSYYSMIARLGLCEKKVPFTIKNMDIQVRFDQLKPDYAKIQPNMTVPTLKCGSDILTSSLDIITYIDTHFSGPQLIPTTEQEKAAMQSMLDLHYRFSIEDVTMGHSLRESPLAKFGFRHDLNRAIRHCQRYSQANPELAVVYQKKIAQDQQRIATILDNKNNYPQTLQQLDTILNTLEQQLQTHDFIAGADYTLADIVWTCFLARIFFINMPQKINSRPKLLAYWQRVSQRPSFTQANVWTKMKLSKIFYMLLSLFLR